MTMPSMPLPEEVPEGEAPDDGSFDVVLTVQADGSFLVDGEIADTLEDALKAIIQRVRSRPVGATPHEDMAAGYGAPDVPS